MFGSSYQIARLFGIPIRAHLTLLILLPLFAVNFSAAAGTTSLLLGLLMAVALFASVALHELGHSLVAIRKGCRVREILLLPIGGVAQVEQLPRESRDEFHIAIAGPLVSLALALGAGVVAQASAHAQAGLLARMAGLLAGVNLMLFLFNLLPSFPMDGGRIFRAWLTPRLGRLAATRLAAGIGRYMAILFGLIGLWRLDLMLILIAVFIYQAAGAEYRAVQAEAWSQRRPVFPWEVFSAPDAPHQPTEVEVGPPPYAAGRTPRFFTRPRQAQRDLFDELFQRWR